MKLTRSLIAPLAVVALLSGCSSSSNPTNVTPSLDNSPPAAPTHMSYTIEDGFGVLTWEASSAADLAGYDIYVYAPSPESEESYTKIASTTGSSNSYTLPSMWSDGDHYFRIVAVDESGNTSAKSSAFLGAPGIGGTALPPGYDPTEPVMKRP